LGLLPIGVLGTLLRAKERGLVGLLEPMLDRLQRELGFFISDELRSEILRRAGEA
jgi:predicted nucleic acid-binding protein